jgi:hypothetical protein
MSKTGLARIRNLESKAPPPFEPMTIQWTCVDLNPTPGGAPIPVGVVRRIKCQEFDAGVIEVFKPLCPEAELPPELTAVQLEQVNGIRDEYKKPADHVIVWRNAAGGAVVEVSGRPDLVIPLIPSDVDVG